MKKLILEEGFPQILADYPLAVQDHFKDAFVRMFKPFGDNLILSGCGISIAGSDWTIAAGYVVYGGEIMRVAEHTIVGVGGGDVLIAESYETTISNNPKLYLDGNTHPMINEVLCRFIKKTTEVTFVRLLFDMPQMADKLAAMALPGNAAWYSNVAGTYWSLATGVTRSATNPFYISKTLDGQLRLKGSLSWDMLAANVYAGWRQIITINTAGFRPAYPVRFSIPQGVIGSANHQAIGYLFELKANGELWLKHESVGYTIDELNFGSINLNIF